MLELTIQKELTKITHSAVLFMTGAKLVGPGKIFIHHRYRNKNKMKSFTLFSTVALVVALVVAFAVTLASISMLKLMFRFMSMLTDASWSKNHKN